MGSGDHYGHFREEGGFKGYDFRDNETVAWEAKGKYSTHLFAERAEKIIRDAAQKTTPMFLYLALQNPHNPLQVPKTYEKNYQHIQVKMIIYSYLQVFFLPSKFRTRIGEPTTAWLLLWMKLLAM